MNESTLTDKNFWKDYWENKKELIQNLPKNFLLGDKISAIVEKFKIGSAIELGGFPGYYAIYLKKYFGIKTCLLDFFIHQSIIDDLVKINGLDQGSLEIIEGDLFSIEGNKKFDLVCSFGLIEHFDDLKTILGKHLDFLDEKGILYITLPNFRGINGWVQKKLDPENLYIHNLNTMDPQLLRLTLQELGMEVLESEYMGKFTVWLENEGEKPFLSRMIKGGIWCIGKMLTYSFQVKNRLFSPYISVLARRP